MEEKKPHKLSVTEYLDIERETNTKYEYHDGKIYLMAGGTLNHGLICGNIFGEIRAALRETENNCRAMNSEIKVHVNSKNCYLYPDTMVVCGEIEKSESEPNSITNPKVIVEVLSKSTANYDRGDKFYLYRQLESFEEYILIDQDKAQIDIHKRHKGNSDLWKLSRISGLDQSLEIEVLGIKIKLEEIYNDIEFSA